MGDGDFCADERKARLNQVDELEKIRLDGNRMFAERNWTGAIDKYSHCINSLNLGGGAMHVDHDKGKKNLFESTLIVAVNTVLALSYSNRAEVRLRLRDYKEALDDTEQALKSDPFKRHVKSLVRQGKAAHGLELYQKACEAFRLALEEAPEERSIVNLLKESNLAEEQSRAGKYDLTNFFLRGCSGNIPFCADYVGPVEIRRCGDGRRRGLFATKSLEPGELLLVSNPLAAGRSREGTVCNPVGPQKKSPKKLIAELVDKIRRSNLQMVRLRFLASNDIPSMELFRPGSECIPPGGVKEELDVDCIRDIAIKNMFHYADVENGDVAGLWVLPAFAKHSCAPNSQHSFVGDAIFFRASGHIMEGDELTVSYDSVWYVYFTERRETTKNRFKCECDRCLFEESLPPQLSKIYEASVAARELHLPMALSLLMSSAPEQVNVVDKIQASLANARDEVEAVIQSLGSNTPPKQQGWIRASFLSLYVGRLTEDLSIAELRLMVDSNYVYISPKGLGLAARLLLDVQRRCSRDSQTYFDTVDYVLHIYRVYFGKLPDTILHQLIGSNLAGAQSAKMLISPSV